MAEAALPNTIAALCNLSLLPEGMAAIAQPEVGRLLIPWLDSAVSSGPLLSRLIAVLAKGAQRCTAIVEMLLDGGSPPVAMLARFLKSSLDNTELGVPAAASAGGVPDEASEVVVSEGEEDSGDFVGNSVRLLTACSRHAGGPAALCAAGTPPFPRRPKVMIQSLPHCGAQSTQACSLCCRRCFALQTTPLRTATLRFVSPSAPPSLAAWRCACARARPAAQSRPSAINMWSLPQVLAVQPVVPPLLDLAHRGEGQTMKNAAIALGRLASNERCLHAIRENHGIEILARAMKGDVAKTMGTRK